MIVVVVVIEVFILQRHYNLNGNDDKKFSFCDYIVCFDF